MDEKDKADLRLECLRLAVSYTPASAVLDRSAEDVIDLAKRMEAYVLDA